MPEEINRLLTDALADLLFVTEPSGEREPAPRRRRPPRIHFVGNVMIDTLLAQPRARARASTRSQRLGLAPRGYARAHAAPARATSTTRRGSRRSSTCSRRSTQRLPVVFPVHPRTADAIQSRLGGRDARSCARREPLGYLDFLGLMADARLVLTDSGGIQEETHRPRRAVPDAAREHRAAGHGRAGHEPLVGNDPHVIRAEVAKILDGESRTRPRPGSLGRPRRASASSTCSSAISESAMSDSADRKPFYRRLYEGWLVIAGHFGEVQTLVILALSTSS